MEELVPPRRGKSESAWSGLSFSRWTVRPGRVALFGSKAGVKVISGPSGRADAMFRGDNGLRILLWDEMRTLFLYRHSTEYYD